MQRQMSLRPADIPPREAQVLANIEKEGWASVDFKDGFTLLHWAAQKGRGDMCEYLLSLNGSLEMRDSKGLTALDYAKEAGHGSTVRLLEDIVGRVPGASSSRQSATAINT